MIWINWSNLDHLNNIIRIEGTAKDETMQQRLMYSVRELTSLLGLPYEKRITVRRLLKRAGIPLHYSTGPRSKGFVFLDEIKERCPPLWSAVVEAIVAREAA